MARFDVYPHPDSSLRRATPFLLDVQNSHISGLATRIVVPLRPASAFPLRLRDLNPILEIAGREVVADVAALAAFPAAELRTPVTNVRSSADAVASALDTLFGPY
jgi:toxin CcdB